MIVELSEQQRTALVELLGSRISEMGSEIHHTDVHGDDTVA